MVAETNGRKPPLTVYCSSPYGGSASFYYRIEVPIFTCRDLGLPVRVWLDRNDPGTSQEARVRTFCESDVVIIYQPIGEGPINNVRNIQSFVPSKRDGAWKWPPTVVIETDDNLFNVMPLNPAFKNLGIRKPNGELLPLGWKMGLRADDGTEWVEWYDTSQDETLSMAPPAKPFNLVNNRQVVESWRQVLNLADVVSCSTPAVEAAVQREPGVMARRTKVWPNLVRFQDYEQVDLKEDPTKVRIMWQGGAAHYEDWYALRHAIANVTRRHPEVEWIIWGAQYQWIQDAVPAHRMRFLPWSPYAEYKLRLALLNADISLAPLTSNLFNDCRSAIKFYEASVLKKPAATLAQRTAAYKSEIVEGETGLLFDDPADFEDKLATLIENEQQRRTLAANAKDWVNEHRNAMKEVPKMVAYWEQLREERKREQPHVSERQWAEIEAQDKAEQEAEEAAQGAVPV